MKHVRNEPCADEDHRSKAKDYVHGFAGSNLQAMDSTTNGQAMDLSG